MRNKLIDRAMVVYAIAMVVLGVLTSARVLPIWPLIVGAAMFGVPMAVFLVIAVVSDGTDY